MTFLPDLFKDTPIPEFFAVNRVFPDDCIRDVARATVETLENSGLEKALPSGGSIAVGVGSRGIANLPALVAATVAWFRGKGRTPFVVPCMGSHGGATSPGQIKVLADLGVTEESAGCAIKSSMEVVQAGRLPSGLPVYMDAHAWNADAVFVINRVKPHTSFSGPNESGLVKMLTIGLGKQKGADAAHSFGYGLFAEIMPAMTRAVLAAKPSILGGLAVVENETDQTFHVEAVLSADLERRDAELLLLAKSRMPSLPATEIDFLLIDYMGKNVSGAGMDPNITGRNAKNRSGGPKVNRLCVLNLTEETKGNATGVGKADIVSRRLANQINFDYTYANVITSTNLEFVRLPMVLETDADVVRCGVKTCSVPATSMKGVRIRDTLSLTKLFVTSPLAETLKGKEGFSVSEAPCALRFGPDGALDTTVWDDM